MTDDDFDAMCDEAAAQPGAESRIAADVNRMNAEIVASVVEALADLNLLAEVTRDGVRSIVAVDAGGVMVSYDLDQDGNIASSEVIHPARRLTVDPGPRPAVCRARLGKIAAMRLIGSPYANRPMTTLRAGTARGG